MSARRGTVPRRWLTPQSAAKWTERRSRKTSASISRCGRGPSRKWSARSPWWTTSRSSPGPPRDAFGIASRLDYYPASDLQEIVRRSAGKLGVRIDEGGAKEIARRARGTPRIANRLLRRVRDFAEVEGDGTVSREAADRALLRLEVDGAGLDPMDRKILLSLIDKFAGGPVGLDTLATAVGEQADTLEDVYEPYLMTEGYLVRTPRGRAATARAYEHLGRKVPAASQGSLL